MIQRIRYGLIVSFCIGLLSVIAWASLGNVTFISAKLVAEPVPLHPAWDGQVVEIFVKKGDFVKKGQALMRLDSRIHEVRLENAKAFLEAWGGAENDTNSESVPQLTKKILALQARVYGLREEEQQARMNVEAQVVVHVQKLLALRGLDSQALPVEAAARKSAITQEREAREGLARVRANFDGVSRARVQIEQDTRTATQALLIAKQRQLYAEQVQQQVKNLAEKEQYKAKAQAERIAAQKAVDAAIIVAPFDGRIVELDLVNNEFVTLEKVVARIQAITSPSVWIRASVDSNEATHLFIDMPVLLRTPERSSKSLSGHIIAIEIDEPLAEVRIAFDDFDAEIITSLQHEDPVYVNVSWWGRVQSLWH